MNSNLNKPQQNFNQDGFSPKPFENDKDEDDLEFAFKNLNSMLEKTQNETKVDLGNFSYNN